eukprot:bmy_02138T0
MKSGEVGRNLLCIIPTLCRHVQNTIKAATSIFHYKVRSVYAYFPISIIIQENGYQKGFGWYLSLIKEQFSGQMNNIWELPSYRNNEMLNDTHYLFVIFQEHN